MQSIGAELTRLLEKQSATDNQIQMLTGEVRSLLNKAITETRRIEEEARDESVREVILRELQGMSSGVMLGELTNLMNDKYGIGSSEVMDELDRLKDEGVLSLPNNRNKAGVPIALLRAPTPNARNTPTSQS